MRCALAPGPQALPTVTAGRGLTHRPAPPEGPRPHMAPGKGRCPPGPQLPPPQRLVCLTRKTASPSVGHGAQPAARDAPQGQVTLLQPLPPRRPRGIPRRWAGPAVLTCPAREEGTFRALWEAPGLKLLGNPTPQRLKGTKTTQRRLPRPGIQGYQTVLCAHACASVRAPAPSPLHATGAPAHRCC